jgi:hypothetical protein
VVDARRHGDPAPFGRFLELHAQTDVLRNVLPGVAWKRLLRQPGISVEERVEQPLVVVPAFRYGKRP